MDCGSHRRIRASHRQSRLGHYKDGITEAVANALFVTDLAPFEAVVGSSISVGLQQYEYCEWKIYSVAVYVPL